MKRFFATNPIVDFTLVVIFLAGLIGIPPTAQATGNIRLTLKEATVIDQGPVRLSDVAVLGGSSDDERRRLGSISIATAPLPGQTRFVGIDYIRVRLKQAGVDTARMQFGGSRNVRISRRSVALPADKIRLGVEKAIRYHMPWRPEDVTLGEIRIDESVHLPVGPLTYRVVPAPDEDYLGRTVLAVHLYVDGEPVKKVTARTSISVMADVVVANRPLAKRRRIERSDLAMERRDLAMLPAGCLRRIEDAIGNRASDMIYPRTVLQANMITTPPVVRRGDIVRITASAGPMVITATGKAKQQGCKGETVHVVNTDSNRIITARVTGPGAVEVDF
jgi:flagella basal body P-ring formation protein FlgA